MGTKKFPHHDSIIDMLHAAMADQHFPTLKSAQRFADDFMRRANARPLDDFCGLSSEQMYGVLHHPFDSPQLVEIRKQIPLESAANAPLLSLFLQLVEAIGDSGIKPTAKGNLPRALCRELALVHWGESEHAERTRFGGINTETDFFDLHVVHVVAQLAGLVRRYKGKIIVSRKCRNLVAANGGNGLYFALFESYVRKFNWAYRDGHPDLPFVQHSFLFTLYLLSRFGQQMRSVKFYENAYLQAFPMLLDEMPVEGVFDLDPATRFHWLYSQRCLKGFAAFAGLAEVQAMEGQDPLFSTEFAIKATPLLGALARFLVQ